MGARREDVHEAVENLSAIRDAIDLGRIESRSQSRAEAYIILQTLIVVCSGTFTLLELYTSHQMTGFLKAASQDQEYFRYSIAYMGVLLTIISGTAAMIFARSAKLSGDDVSNYLDRHFRSFGDFSIFSDLGLKLLTLAALLAAGQSSWIAPMLFAFTCDYVLHRRVIQLSNFWTIATALALAAAGTVQLLSRSDLLLWPLLGFTLISAISLASMIRHKKVRP